MVLSLVDLCAKEVVRDHSSSPSWLCCVPRELYDALLRAACSGGRPLAVGELVQRWPERRLKVGDRRISGLNPPNRLCIQALLLAVVRGLSDHRSMLQVLDLCGLQRDEGGDPMGGWSLTVALCSMLVQARAGVQARREGGLARRDGEGERKRVLALEREREGAKRERAPRKREREGEGEGEVAMETNGGEGRGAGRTEEEQLKGVRRRMEQERRRGGGGGSSGEESASREGSREVLLQVRADLFVNARSWERVRTALSGPDPLRLSCRFLRVEELSVSNTRRLLELAPPRGLLGVDLRYSSLGMEGLASLLPLLASFPALGSLRLHYCNLELRGDAAGQEEVLKEVALGLSRLPELRRLSLTALRLPGHLRLLLSSLARPLHVLELPYLSLSPADLAFLSCSHHASSLQRLDLSENRLDASSLPSVRRLLSSASSSLLHLTLSGCGLTDGLLGALLPSVTCCRALRSLGLALNPLSLAGLTRLVKGALGMASLRHLLYPNALEEYQPGLPELPSSAQLLDWPLDELQDASATSSQLHRLVREAGRTDLVLTCDLLNYHHDLLD
ncbi:leucine-rich repeat-containing protein 14 [Gadus macrocephalus]|uniref:leucine-rich repeat-containing protein 14 n=1 Tax=Gadus macrocephalus TaxID=80720 RepID=UPI0028CB4DF9|nr:leucine-rich repeat-containing protein 14 [Gadus macrocephalus]